jgi:hypothetical protein
MSTIEINFRSAVDYLEDFSTCFTGLSDEEDRQDLAQFEAIIWAFYCTKNITSEQFEYFIDKHSKLSEYLDEK